MLTASQYVHKLVQCMHAVERLWCIELLPDVILVTSVAFLDWSAHVGHTLHESATNCVHVVE